MDWIGEARPRPAAVGLAELEALCGQEVAHSRRLVVSQRLISDFGRLTGDEQYIHMDPERAALGPFGGTVAHGFLTLSLLAVLSADCLPPLRGVRASVNYGFDRVRLIRPVRAGTAISARFTLLEVTPRRPGEVLLRYGVEVEGEGLDAPAVVAEWLALHLLEPAE